MLRFVEPFRQHNLSATFRANVRAMRATTVTPRLNVAEHPKRSLAFIEFSAVMTCWTLKVHLVVYDLKVTLVTQIVKRHNVNDHRVAGVIITSNSAPSATSVHQMVSGRLFRFPCHFSSLGASYLQSILAVLFSRSTNTDACLNSRWKVQPFCTASPFGGPNGLSNCGYQSSDPSFAVHPQL